MMNLWKKLKIACIFVTVMTFVSFMSQGVVYPGTNQVERGLENGSRVMAPGWINIDKQRSQSLKEQTQKKKTTEEQIEAINADLDKSAFETQPGKVKPELKKKTSKTENASTTTSQTQEIPAIVSPGEGSRVIDSSTLHYDVAFGSGTEKEYNANGRLVSEKIGGVQHIYVGDFEDDTGNKAGITEGENLVQLGIAHADTKGGGIVIVRGGEYTGHIDMKDGVSLYGGYSETGKRDVDATPSILKVQSSPDIGVSDNGGIIAKGIGSSVTELNGFTIKNDPTERFFPRAVRIINCSDKIIISNNRFESKRKEKYGVRDVSWGTAIDIGGSEGVIIDNNIIEWCSYGIRVRMSGYDFSPIIISNNIIRDAGRVLQERYSKSIVTNNFFWKFEVQSEYCDSVYSKNTFFGGHSSGGYDSGQRCLQLRNSKVALSENIFTDAFRPIDIGDSFRYTGSPWGASEIVWEGGNLFYFDNFVPSITPLGWAPAREGDGAVIKITSHDSTQGDLVITSETIPVPTEGNIFHTDPGLDPSKDVYISDIGGYSGGHGTYDRARPSGGDNSQGGNETPTTTTITTTTTNLKPDFRRISSYYSAFGQSPFAPTITLDANKTPMSANNLKAIFEGLLANKDALMPEMKGELDPTLVARLVAEALRGAALAVPAGKMSPQEMEIAMMLASIISNPTEEQKVMLDALAELINEAEKLEEETGSEELKQASDDFTEIVATVLLAQALPDLFKEGDISDIKGIFEELDKEKTHILFVYQAAAKIYYQNMIKELANNLAVLQVKGILGKNMTEKELGTLSLNRIDEIINKIKKVKEKTYTEKHILEKEAEYRKDYLMPAKRLLEQNMKSLLEGFSKKLFSVLEGAGLVEEKVEKGRPAINIDLSTR